MPSGGEKLLALLVARRYLYVLFQSLTGNEPSIEQIDAIDSAIAQEAFEEMAMEEVGLSAHFLEKLTELSLEELKLEELKSEYTRLFIGPGKLKAPPWESVYATKERLLFQRSTLLIRNFYRSEGFIPAEYPHVADDHLAIELDFMAQLALRALEAAQVDDVEAYRRTLAASREFLEEHLLKWVPKYVTDLQEEQATFYPLAARTLLLFLQKDAALLRIILNE